jgi:hypothetical protein
MWILILKIRDYIGDVAINVQNEMHLKRMFFGCVYSILIALNRDQRWDVLNPLMKPGMP